MWTKIRANSDEVINLLNINVSRKSNQVLHFGIDFGCFGIRKWFCLQCSALWLDFPEYCVIWLVSSKVISQDRIIERDQASIPQFYEWIDNSFKETTCCISSVVYVHQELPFICVCVGECSLHLASLAPYHCTAWRRGAARVWRTNPHAARRLAQRACCNRGEVNLKQHHRGGLNII